MANEREAFRSDPRNWCPACDLNFKAIWCEECKVAVCIGCTIQMHQSANTKKHTTRPYASEGHSSSAAGVTWTGAHRDS